MIESLTRRAFSGGLLAASVSPALGQVGASGEVDVAIIGAGAAGIAAARKVAGAGRRFALIEANNRIGGRCHTETQTFGIPYDRGAHWLHMADINPVAKLAPRTGLELYPAPRGQKVRIGRRNAREGEMEDFLSTLVRANRAIGDAARGKVDMSCAQALPKDLGEWAPTVTQILGPFYCGADLDQMSAMDYARLLDRDIDSYCRQGVGALIAKLGEGVNVQLNTPVARITSGRSAVEIETAKGRITARAAIVTVSPAILSNEAIKFTPVLPKRQLEALSKLRMGSFDRIALEMPDNPLGLQRDDLIFEKAVDKKSAVTIANISGTPLMYVDVGGSFGRALADKGQAAMVDFALSWLTDLFGADARKAVKRTHATRWNAEPFALGAMSIAMPGGQLARKTLTEPLRERIFFAGEATHEALWGSVGGAWETGERAADAAIKVLGRR